MSKKLISTKTSILVMNIIFIGIGLSNLIFGADKTSKYYYYDNILIRILGILYVISAIGLWLKKDWARRTLIFLNILSIFEFILTGNLADMKRIDGIFLLSGMLIIFLLPILILLTTSMKIYFSNIEESNAEDYNRTPYCEPITQPSKLSSAYIILFLFIMIILASSVIMSFMQNSLINDIKNTNINFIIILLISIFFILILFKGKILVATKIKDYFSWLLLYRYEKTGDYDKIINRYIKLAQRTNKNYTKNNLLGLAALYKHDFQSAINYFETGLNSAVGNHIDIINSNLAIAYLQGNLYQQAFSLLEYQRENGSVPILPYIIILLVLNREEEAKQFYIDNPIHTKEKIYADTLLSFSALKPDTLLKTKELLSYGEFWIYRPIIENLIELWELKIFFNRTDRYSILTTQGKKLLSQLEKEPQILISKEIRYLRNLISMVIPKVSNFNGCSSLWGLIENLDQFSLTLPISKDLQTECSVFWKRIYYIFAQTSTIETYDVVKEAALINEQLPNDSESIIKVSSKCKLYFSNELKLGIRSIELNQNTFVYHYIDIIPEVKAKSIIEDITPIINVLLKDPSTKDDLEPLLYWLTFNPDVLNLSTIINILTCIPSCYHKELEYLKAKFYS